ncbi:MAG TPA: hypothetical protein VK533_12050 [Sphingomonas sp.]|uniref:hypothetical protein n=1 Tax=Sphingomonas sp. TaxID=28214 RepID=UPI002B9DCEC8|nr:hypothetical protein [Sphingomonas sp.]HMI20268.1 hypothetical protein [Sphingomonas sp.]
MTRFAIPMLAAALAAVPIQAAVTIANPASDQMARLSVIQRKGALRAALLDSGVPCERVEKTNIQGPWANTILWRAKCSGDPRNDYAVFVGPDASVQVRYCAEMAELKLPKCRPFSNNPPAAIRLAKPSH